MLLTGETEQINEFPMNGKMEIYELKRETWHIFVSYRRSAITIPIALWIKRELEGATIEAESGQLFKLDVFVDIDEPHNPHFQQHLLPHLHQSRALIAIIDDSATARRRTGDMDYLYQELEWWAVRRRKTPPIILQLNAQAGRRLVAQKPFTGWGRVNFLDIVDQGSGESPRNERVVQQLLESIRDYGKIIHLIEVRRLKRRAIAAFAFAVASIVGAYGAIEMSQKANWQSVIAKQKEFLANKSSANAQRQAQRARNETRRAEYENYISCIGLALAKSEAGAYSDARTVLSDCSKSYRGWEWWFLMARVGPAPVNANEINNWGDKAISSALMAAQKNEVPEGGRYNTVGANAGNAANEIKLSSWIGGGSPGAEWFLARGTSSRWFLLNHFFTGRLGRIHNVSLKIPDCVYWDTEVGESWEPQMQTGDYIQESGAYICAYRERYCVGDCSARGRISRPPVGKESRGRKSLEPDAMWLANWADKQTPEKARWNIKFGLSAPHTVSLSGGALSNDAVWNFNAEAKVINVERTKTSVLFDRVELDSPSGKPSKAGLLAVESDYKKLSKEERENFSVSTECGLFGPMLFASWGIGSVRLYDGSSGKVIGESVNPNTSLGGDESEKNLSFYGGRTALIPKSTKVAGWIWWGGKLVVGIVDVATREMKVLLEGEEGRQPVYGPPVLRARLRCSPDAKELVFSLKTRIDDEFAVWDVDTGKLVFGVAPGGGGAADNGEEFTYEDIPVSFNWDVKGRCVAIGRQDGTVDIRRRFSERPIGHVKGVGVEALNVAGVGDDARLIIGGYLIDTQNWRVLLKLPDNMAVSEDGNIVAIQTAEDCVDIVRCGFRSQKDINVDDVRASIPEKMILRQTHDAIDTPHE